MGLLGGSAQGTITNSANISYSPVLIWGEDNKSDREDYFAPTQDVSPKLDESMGVSAGVAIGAGSSAQGGTVAREESPTISDKDNLNPTFGQQAPKDKNNVLIGGAIIIGGAILYKTFKKAK